MRELDNALEEMFLEFMNQMPKSLRTDTLDHLMHVSFLAGAGAAFYYISDVMFSDTTDEVKEFIMRKLETELINATKGTSYRRH